MSKSWLSLFEVDLAGAGQREQLRRLALRRNWGLSLVLVGWLHLLAFGLCHYLTIVQDYHNPAVYLAIWVSELCGVWLIFRACGGARRAEPVQPLEGFLRRVWVAYLFLGLNLGTLNGLLGKEKWELFPAIAALASFAFLMMTVVLDRRFFGAVLVMFASGLLMAATFPHIYLVFGVAWWLVLHGIGVTLLRQRRQLVGRTGEENGEHGAACAPPVRRPGGADCSSVAAPSGCSPGSHSPCW